MRSSRLIFPAALHFAARADWARAVGIDAGNTPIHIINAVTAKTPQTDFITSPPQRRPNILIEHTPAAQLLVAYQAESAGGDRGGCGYVASGIAACSRSSSATTSPSTSATLI